MLLGIGAALLALVAASAWLVIGRGEGDRVTASSTIGRAGLPETSDYHSLLVGDGGQQLLLGTHQGLFRSSDGGRHWRQAGLVNQDAMNIAMAGDVQWVAGHDVLARSTDGGKTWTDAFPDGLPSRDVHGFTVDPSTPGRLYAAIAGQGLFRSDDAGDSYQQVSRVGADVMGLSMTPTGGLFAADMARGLLVSRDGGRTWRQVLAQPMMSVAVNQADPRLVLAGATGLYVSRDGGRSFRPSGSVNAQIGPVAWSPGSPKAAFAVAYDRRLYRTNDAGASWTAVTEN